MQVQRCAQRIEHPLLMEAVACSGFRTDDALTRFRSWSYPFFHVHSIYRSELLCFGRFRYSPKRRCTCRGQRARSMCGVGMRRGALRRRALARCPGHRPGKALCRGSRAVGGQFRRRAVLRPFGGRGTGARLVGSAARKILDKARGLFAPSRRCDAHECVSRTVAPATIFSTLPGIRGFAEWFIARQPVTCG